MNPLTYKPTLELKNHRPTIVFTSKKERRWFIIRLPNGGRDPQGWWLAPLIRIERSRDYHTDDGEMLEIPFIARDHAGLHFHAIYR